jgi:hypothetical protein
MLSAGTSAALRSTPHDPFRFIVCAPLQIHKVIGAWFFYFPITLLYN